MDQTQRIRAAIESTLLGPRAEASTIRTLTEDAVALGVRGVCVPPSYVSLAHTITKGTPVKVITVANFPFGQDFSESVWITLLRAEDNGADEIDIVAPYARALEGDWAAYRNFLRSVMGAVDLPIKVILETAALDLDQIQQSAAIAADCGAAWVKTSTGFHPAGGATGAAVRAMRTAVPCGVKIKASGGMKTAMIANEMLDAGASSIGTSSAKALLGAEDAALASAVGY